MHLSLTAPLTIRHIVSRKPYELLPVAMARATPSTDPTLWRKFVKLGGRVLPITLEDTQRVREGRPYVFTDLLRREGLDEIIAFIEKAGGLSASQAAE